MEYEYKHWRLVAHSLGINLYHAMKSERPKDKELPNEFYRNYFASSKGSDGYNLLKELEVNGLTHSWVQNDHIYFMVTDKGIVEFREWFYENVTVKYKKPTKSKLRYQHFLELDSGMSFFEYLKSPYCLK